MLHPVDPHQQTLTRSQLSRDEHGTLIRRPRASLDDLYRRIDEDLADL